MAKYSAFKFGSGTKYGTVDPVIVTDGAGDVTWVVNIRWNGTDNVNEAGYLTNFVSFQGSEHYIDSGGNGFEALQPGQAVLTMDNSDRRFDPNYTGSPLYPYVVPGRDVQILVYINATNTMEEVFTGFVTDIQPVSGSNEVQITVEDALRQLADNEYSEGIIYNWTVSQYIGHVLDSAGFTGARNINYTNQPVQVFDPPAQDSLTIVNDLATAALGIFYIDRRGRACFHPISTESSVAHTVTESEVLRDIRLPQPWETVRNKIKITCNRRGRRPESIIWNLPAVYGFLSGIPGQYTEYEATWENSMNVNEPVPYINYMVNSQADGNGTDMTMTVNVALTEITTSGCTVTVTNPTDQNCYLRIMRLTGNAIVSSPIVFKNEDATSINFYRARQFSMNNTFLQDQSFANQYCSWLLDYFKSPRQNPVIQIQQRPELQYAMTVMDNVALTSSYLNISTTLPIRGIRHEWQNDTGQNVLTTVYLHDRLFNDTVLTPDPFIPGAEEIIDVPFPETPPWSDPWTPPIKYPREPEITNACLLTDAGETGGYPVTADNVRLENKVGGNREAFIWYPCTLRPQTALNKSTMNIWGGWSFEQSTSDGEYEWLYDVENAWWHCDAISSNKTVLCEGTLTNLTNYQRTAVFTPTSPIEVAGFRIWIDDAVTYGYYDQVQTGTLSSTDSVGTLLNTTLTRYYAIESAGGPFDVTTPSDNCYRGNLKDAGGRLSGGFGYRDADGWLLQNGTIGLYCEQVLPYYGRLYFKAQAATRYRAYDYNDDSYYADNSGNIGFILYNASVAGNKLMTINNLSLKNVCGSGIL